MNDKNSNMVEGASRLIRKDWQKFFLIVLLILSLSYLAWDFWGKQKNNWMSRGYAVAVSELIEAANDPNCSPFPVRFDERSVYLINYDCLLGEDGSADVTNGLFLDEDDLLE